MCTVELPQAPCLQIRAKNHKSHWVIIATDKYLIYKKQTLNTLRLTKLIRYDVTCIPIIWFGLRVFTSYFEICCYQQSPFLQESSVTHISHRCVNYCSSSKNICIICCVELLE